MSIDVTDTNFQQTVLESPVPVLVDFWAPWCGPCRTVAPILEEIEADLSGTLTVAKLNVDENPMVASTFRVQSIPYLVLFDGGQPVGSLVGAHPKDSLMAFIEARVKNLGVQALEADELAVAIEAGDLALVDIRQAMDYERGHLPGALSIPVDDVEADVPQALLDMRGDRLVLYCRSGSDSMPFARRLSNDGFTDVSTVKDGVLGWEASGRKLEQA